MKAFFPGHILETGHDILFFWVARMVMMSLCLTDKLPFTEVFLHAMIRDKDGKKMSKSLGNVIDPLEVMDGCGINVLVEKLTNSNLPPTEIKRAAEMKKKEFPTGIPECGTDALRFGLLAYMIQIRNINLDVKRVLGYRFFCNKMWNTVKFVFMKLPEGFQAHEDFTKLKFSFVDKWILARLKKTILDTNANLENYGFGDTVNGLYDFWLKDMCDNYLELTKPVLTSGTKEEQNATLNTLVACIDICCRLLHPIMPYLTEELYQRLPLHPKNKAKSVSIAPYPEDLAINLDDEQEVNDDMDLLLNYVKGVRSVLGNLGVPKNKKPDVYARISKGGKGKFRDQAKDMIISLARTNDVRKQLKFLVHRLGNW
jgi:valyl-tRNA synthetase